jgi:subtilisin family serine protease
MKKLLLILIFILPFSLQAQEKLSYKIGSENIEFQIAKEQYFIKYKQNDKVTIQQQVKDFVEVSGAYALVTVEIETQNNFSLRKSMVNQKLGGRGLAIEPVLIAKDGIKQVCKGELVIKLKDKTPIGQLLSGYVYTVETDMFVENQYLLKIENISTHQLLFLSDKLNENSKVDFAAPNFTRFLKPYTNDTHFNSQWAIRNLGYLGSTNDADMDVPEAWSLSTGQGIRVAIIDEGVNLTHPDLAANMLPGFDATGNNSGGAPQNNDAHGTACAGIVSAVANNGIGVAGVAYNSMILPVRIAFRLPPPFDNFWETNDQWIANGINWAVNNDADVLNCSWGGGEPSLIITNAINNAVTNGRNLRGSIVLFASGNFDGAVSYPAVGFY